MVPFFLLLAPPAISAPTPSRAIRLEKSLAPGIDFFQEVLPAGNPNGPQVINVVRLSPGVVASQLRSALAQDRVWGTDPTFGRETVSSLARRTGATVAINAGFFPFQGNPIGLHVEGGELVTEPSRERSSFVIGEDGKATVHSFRWNGTISIGTDRRPLDGLNRKPGKGNELLAFTSKFFSKTLAVPDRLELVLDGSPSPLRPGAKFTGTVKSTTVGGETTLENGGLVLSAGGEIAAWLREKAPVGTSISIDLGVAAVRGATFDPATIRDAVTGAGRLLSDNKQDLDLKQESIAESFSSTRHPRTAAGVCDDGSVLLVTVDGRQTGLSRGMSLPELAETMRRLGARQALNLDGGGSTAMAIFGGIVNSPSDAAERAVADMLVVTQGLAPSVSTDLPGFSLAWPQLTLKAGDAFVYPKPVGVKESQTVWSTEGNVGFVDQQGRFRAIRPGVGKIRIKIGSRSAETEVRVETPPKMP